jgi:hypothetical protein
VSPVRSDVSPFAATAIAAAALPSRKKAGTAGAMSAIDLYLDLLKKSLTDTLRAEEPDADDTDPGVYVVDFVRHYIRGDAVTMLPMARLDNLQHCIARAVADGVPGDLIETGVWRGGASIFMRGALAALGDETRTVWVADSFEGLPEPDPEKFPREAEFHKGELMQEMYDRFAADLESVKRNFEIYGLLDDRVRFLKGWFKDTLPTAPIQQLAVMRLDGDYYDSTMDGLTNLYGKLSSGGFAIIDDYGEDVWTECRRAVDEFRAAQGITAPLVAVDSKCSFWRKA